MMNFRADRRSLIGGGILLAGAGAAGTPAAGQAIAAAASGIRPTAETLDGWMDRAGTRHRMVFDTTTFANGMAALDFANTFYHMNQQGYGIAPADIGTIIVFRHGSTALGYSDAIWSRHGAGLAKQLKLTGKLALAAAKGNPVLHAVPGDTGMPGMGWIAEANLDALFAKGAQFAVCGVGTRIIAMGIADKTGGKADDAEAELKANLIPGAVIVPAGIVAVNRAQEHGYSFAFIGE